MRYKIANINFIVYPTSTTDDCVIVSVYKEGNINIIEQFPYKYEDINPLVIDNEDIGVWRVKQN